MGRRSSGNFQFTGFELTLLGIGFTLASVLVFFLGFYVGRMVSAEHAPADAMVARVPVSSSPHGAVRSLTPRAGPEALEPSKPRSEKGDAVDGGSRAPSTGAATAVSQGESPADRQRQKSESSPSTASDPSGTHLPDGVDVGSPLGEADLPGAVDEERVAVDSTGTYTVQVLATRDREEAFEMAGRLRDREFDAFVKPNSDGRGTWYRVRVGRFRTYAEARSMQERCNRSLGLESYVTRD
ncbi:MAG: SPOR domain-containing protein [Candidatus Binatia bacterium]